jgi:hypothetical protein
MVVGSRAAGIGGGGTRCYVCVLVSASGVGGVGSDWPISTTCKKNIHQPSRKIRTQRIRCTFEANGHSTIRIRLPHHSPSQYHPSQRRPLVVEIAPIGGARWPRRRAVHPPLANLWRHEVFILQRRRRVGRTRLDSRLGCVCVVGTGDEREVGIGGRAVMRCQYDVRRKSREDVCGLADRQTSDIHRCIYERHSNSRKGGFVEL